MLKVGKERATALGYQNIEWVCGDAQNLPFADQVFDAYTIAYGMRNVVDVDKVRYYFICITCICMRDIYAE